MNSETVIGIAGIGGTLVGAGLGALGATRAARIAARAERAHWMRQTRRNTYGEFTLAARRVTRACHAAHSSATGDELREEQIEECKRLMDKFEEATSMVALESPRDLGDAAWTLCFAASSWLGMLGWVLRSAPGPNDDVWVRLNDRANEVDNELEEFEEIFRRALSE